MAFPDDLTTVTVTHPIADPALRPLPGVVVAVPTGRQWKQGEGSILPAEYTAPIEDGTWTLVLPAVDQFVNLEAYRIEERPTEGGKPWGRAYHIAPALEHAPGPVDATDVITAPPRGGDIVFTAGPATDSSMTQVAQDPDSAFRAELMSTIDSRVEDVAPPIVGQVLRDDEGVRQAIEAAIEPAVQDKIEGLELVTSPGVNVPRTLAKLRAGLPITIGVIGDSKSDPSTPGNAEGGPVEKFAALLEARFGTSVTVVNAARSGATAATQFLQGRVQTVVDAAPDLTVVHLGTNDTNSDANSLYAPGYARSASLAAIERAVAYVRDAREDAEVLFISTGPYTNLSSPSNVKLEEYATDLRALAATVGAEWVDAYAAFLAYADAHGGSIADLMYDSTHQNAAGNDLYAATMLAHFPEVSEPRPTPALAPRARRGRFDIAAVDKATSYLGYVIQPAPSTTPPLTFTLTGTGWTTEGGYDVSSTAGDRLTLTADAREFLYNIDIAAQPVLDFILDGTTIATDVDLHSLSSKNSTAYWVAPFIDLPPGEHVAELVVKGGTLRVQSTAALLNATADSDDPDEPTFEAPIRTVVVYDQANTTTLTTSYQNIVSSTPLELPAGWQGMDVEFGGFAAIRCVGAMTAERNVDFAVRLAGTSVPATRQIGLDKREDTSFFPYLNLSGARTGVTATQNIDVVARVSDATDTIQVTRVHLYATLVRTA